jgi:L-alanine-DL-glutamate epimerase-like enolase superfamily enzyme
MTIARPVVVELHDGSYVGRGECEAHELDLDAIQRAQDQLEQLRPRIEREGFSRAELQCLLPACPIRNAIDCALWDLEAKRTSRRAWELAEFEAPPPITTVYTISVDEPHIMAAQAQDAREMPLLKVKLRGTGDLERISAVREAAPNARLIVDANEAWSFDQLVEFAPRFSALGVELIEQPLPRGADSPLAEFTSPVPLCADESCHDTSTLSDVLGRYQFINIKLDKTGGLTEAIRLYRQARAHDLGIMVGCMVGTSLAMAPALLIAQYASFVDLDGPLLLAHDRKPGLMIRDGRIEPPPVEVWG